MSEAEQILAEFTHARYAERSDAGIEPCVCVAGWISYHALGGVIMALYEGILVPTTEKWQGFIEYQGVKIYPSRSIETGFYFGHLEPPP